MVGNGGTTGRIDLAAAIFVSPDNTGLQGETSWARVKLHCQLGLLLGPTLPSTPSCSPVDIRIRRCQTSVADVDRHSPVIDGCSCRTNSLKGQEDHLGFKMKPITLPACRPA